MDPIITPIVGLAASATISGIADMTTIAEGLLTLWSTVKGIVEKNRSVNDRIDRAINKAKQKVSGRHWFDQPILISNLDILKNVLHKANNEELEISDAQTKDVFNDIYDEIINNKEFWEILQSLLTEHRFEIINGKAEEIQRKVDEVIAQIKTVVITLEKAYLSIDEFRPYYPLDKELFIDEEEDRKLYRDEALIEKIHQNLDGKHVYLIQSSEGRGKTTLCRIIASNYYSQDTKVYFIDLKSNVGIDAIRRCFIELDKTKTKTILVLENVHAFVDLEALVSLINSYRKDTDNQLYFLLNARPTESEYATELKELGEDNIFDLRPLREYCKRVARCLCRDKLISEGQLASFISKRIYAKIYTNQKNAGANLRLLRVYCSEWNEGNYSSILDIREEDILERFKRVYGLRRSTILAKNTLLYLSSIYQFDVPLSEALLTNEENDALQQFYQEGLCTWFDHRYYLPHSFEATLLCKAICYDNQFIAQTSEMVKNKFINTILANSNPRKFESDFRLLTQGLIERKDEFQVLINELVDWPMAEKIIRNINPGFIIQTFNIQNGHSFLEILEYYKANIGWLKTSILELSPATIQFSYNTFKKQLNYNICEDLFKDPKDLENYLRIDDRIFYYNAVLRAIGDLGGEHRTVLINHYKQNLDKLKISFLKASPIQLNFVFLFFKKRLNHNILKDIFKNPDDLDNYLRINNCISLRKTFFNNQLLKGIKRLGVRYKFVLKKYKFKLYNYDYDDILRMKNNGFSFDGVHWEAIPIIINTIQKYMNAENQQDSMDMVKNIIQNVLDKKDFLSYASAQDLSLLFKSIASVEKGICQKLMEEESVIIDIKKRLDTFTCTTDNLYLFSRFYFQPWCKKKMDVIIDDADEEQKKVIKEWYVKVWNGLQEGGKTMESESMLAYIHNKFFNEQQNN